MTASETTPVILEVAVSKEPRAFDSLVDQFRLIVGDHLQGSYEDRTFAEHLCGEAGLFLRLVSALLGDPKPGEDVKAAFEEELATFDRRILEGWGPSDQRRDVTFLPRWRAFHALIRSQLVETATQEYVTRLKEAKTAFDETWGEQGVAFSADSMGDPRWAKSADGSLFSKVGSSLTPWTPGSWMVWDVLSGWNKSVDPVAGETTPVLFAFGTQGQVMRLTVEALPGPPGLVTPDWWRLGLCAFETRDRNKAVLSSVGRVIHLAGVRSVLRFRWHLAGKLDAWKYPLEGRSIEAAAAVATLAVLEQYEDRKRPGATHPLAVLDPHAVVTGVVETKGPDPFAWALEPVTAETLPAKWQAANSVHLDVVCVPAKQPIADLARPEAARPLIPVPTVGDALEELRAVQRAFANYGKSVRDKFAYHEVSTPTAS